MKTARAILLFWSLSMQKDSVIPAGDTSPDINHDAVNQTNGDFDNYEVVTKDKVLLILLLAISDLAIFIALSKR